MELTLENNFLRVEINSVGAELMSIYHKDSDRQYLWNGDPTVWDRQSPLLFPNCGTAKNGKYLIEGREYKALQHGFARDLNHKVVCSSDQIATFRLESSKETAEFYPYVFALKTTYKLEKNSLLCQHKVINYDGKPIYFSFGYHTGIRCPFVPGTQNTDYDLVFEQLERCEQMSNAHGVICSQTTPYEPTSRRIPITPGVFTDSLILKGVQSSYIQLEERASGDYCRIRGANSPYTVLWSTPNEVRTVCIEPWYGIGDTDTFDGALEHKEGIHCLQPMEEFICAQTIEIGNSKKQ